MSTKTKNDAKSQSKTPETQVSQSAGKAIYLDKDVDKKYPLQAHDLKNVITFQYTEITIYGTTIKLPATHINPIGMYTPEEYEMHAEEGGLFDSLQLKHEVWHTPEPETQEEPEEDKPNDDKKD